MAEKKNIKSWQMYAVIVITVVGVVFFITGIVLMSTCYEIHVDITRLKEYSDCKNNDGSSCNKEILPCICYESLKLTKDLVGIVTIYYELETFNQNNESYVKSRDNKQLAGDLSSEPSADCGEFRYDDITGTNKSIAPCGAIADSMFNDTLLITTSEDDYVPLLYNGMLSDEDKKGFHNPPGDSLQHAFENYTKPKSWKKPVWELDESKYHNGSNNGFENERFIGWMRTDWKRKPMWRVNHTQEKFIKGLPNGLYTMRITYNYPASLYSGNRTLFAENAYPIFKSTRYVNGIALLVIGLILLVALTLCGIYVYSTKRFTFTGIYQGE